MDGRMHATVHLVLNDFGRLGIALVETDPMHADQETIVCQMIAGQYDNPIRVDAYNILAGRAWDASRDIARLIAKRCEPGCMPPGVRAFCERNGALPRQAA
jgi:hypothetical protein